MYDPFARFGELAAEFVRGSADPAAVRVVIEHPHPAELRLAGMWLAAAGARAELAMTPSPPPGGATFVLTNPPFGQHTEREWLRRCVASLAEDGRAAVLMPYGAGFDPGTRAHDFRRELVETGAVLAVITLPAQMFPGSSIGVCIWLLRQPTGHAAPVQLVDARKLGRPSGDLVAACTRLRRGGHRDDSRGGRGVRNPSQGLVSWPPPTRSGPTGTHCTRRSIRTARSPRRRRTRHARSLTPCSMTSSSPSYVTGRDAGWPRHRLEDRLRHPRRRAPRLAETGDIPGRTAREAVPVIHPRHLRDGLIQADDAPDADAADAEDVPAESRRRALGPDRGHGPDRDRTSQRVRLAPHTNLLRLRVTETAQLNPAYLLAYLSQASVQARIRDRSVRSVTTSLSTATLGDLEIPLPPLTDQQRILSALQSLDEQTAAIEQRLSAARAARTALARHLTEGTVILTGGETGE